MLKQLLYCASFSVYTIPLLAQRTADLSVNITSPADNAMIASNSPCFLTVQVTNSGTDDLVSADSLLVYMSIDGIGMTFQPGNTDHAVRTGNAIDAGSNYSFTINTVFTEGFENSAHDLCISVLPQNTDDPVVDTDNSDNEDCIAIYVTGSTAGLADNESMSLHISPNPASEWVSLGVTPDDQRANLTGINGMQVFSLYAGDESIDVRNIPSGTYLLQFTVQDVLYVRRLTILHQQ